MKKHGILIFIIVSLIVGMFVVYKFTNNKPPVLSSETKKDHWFILRRKTNVEYFYLGVPGDVKKSILLKTFTVKTGSPGERPTPLPSLTGKKYWLVTKKESSNENPETSPYFLTLNVPGIEEEPYGPVPYEECKDEFGNKAQCNWILPGAFGLHGVNGDLSRLSPENPGSSGCIRHRDEDITYLYNLLEPSKESIRYYIEDI